MWLVNLFSLFSCFGALIVLLFIAIKGKKKFFWKFLILILIIVYTYASGILKLIITTGFSLPDLEYLELIPSNPTGAYFFSSILLLIQSWLIISTVNQFFKITDRISYYLFLPILFIGLIIPDFLLIFFKDFVLSNSNVFMILKLLLYFSILEYGIIMIILKRKSLHKSYIKPLTIISFIFCFFTIPSMFIEDILLLSSKIITLNIFEALGFFFLMTSVIIIGINYLILISKKGSDKVSLLDISQKFGLTTREMDVLKELVAVSGSSYKEIAQKLNISPETVKTHVSRIYKKLGVSAKQELKYKIQDFSFISPEYPLKK